METNELSGVEWWRTAVVSGAYLTNIGDEFYGLKNIFIASILSNGPDSPAADFAFDFYQNTKYVYRSIDAPDSQPVLANEDQMNKALAEAGIPQKEISQAAAVEGSGYPAYDPDSLDLAIVASVVPEFNQVDKETLWASIVDICTQLDAGVDIETVMVVYAAEVGEYVGLKAVGGLVGATVVTVCPQHEALVDSYTSD